MELSDNYLRTNRDWDPSYLSMLFDQDFHDVSDLWSSNVQDSDLVSAIDKLEIYSPEVEDISLDDCTLCEAVEFSRSKLHFIIRQIYVNV